MSTNIKTITEIFEIETFIDGQHFPKYATVYIGERDNPRPYCRCSNSNNCDHVEQVKKYIKDRNSKRDNYLKLDEVIQSIIKS